jgi:hypothetical protein
MGTNMSRVALPHGAGNGPARGGSRPGDTSRPCPVAGCAAVISASRLMCRRHWYRLPKPIRDLVWFSWRSGAGLFTPAYQHAASAAIATALGPATENRAAS